MIVTALLQQQKPAEARTYMYMYLGQGIDMWRQGHSSDVQYDEK